MFYDFFGSFVEQHFYIWIILCQKYENKPFYSIQQWQVHALLNRVWTEEVVMNISTPQMEGHLWEDLFLALLLCIIVTVLKGSLERIVKVCRNHIYPDHLNFFEISYFVERIIILIFQQVFNSPKNFHLFFFHSRGCV